VGGMSSRGERGDASRRTSPRRSLGARVVRGWVRQTRQTGCGEGGGVGRETALALSDGSCAAPAENTVNSHVAIQIVTHATPDSARASPGVSCRTHHAADSTLR